MARMLGDEPGLEIVGAAASGEELLANLDLWRPDVITLDLTMPGMGGLPTLDQIMEVRPTPVIILSTHAGEGAPLTIEALHRGAVDFIDKQRYSLMDFGALRQVLLDKILQVVSGGRLRSSRPFSGNLKLTDVEAAANLRIADSRPPSPSQDRDTLYDLIVMGASTGGPPTIEKILGDLGPDLRVPLAIVQHMPARFTKAFADRLNAHLQIHVREAVDGEPLLPATAYIAPGGLHLRIRRHERHRFVVSLSRKPEHLSHRPSVDVLFSSAAESAVGRSIGVLLTGMGRDGAVGMSLLAKAGAWTIAQDRKSSTVYGMPQAAHALNAVKESMTPEKIGPRMRELLEEGS